MTSSRKLSEGATVFTEIKIGRDIAKRRMGTVEEIGKRGARVRFSDGHMMWVEAFRLHIPDSAGEGASDMNDSPKEPKMPRIPSGAFRTDGRSVAASTTAPPPPKPAREAAPAAILPPARPANDPQSILDEMRAGGRDPFAMLVALADAVKGDRQRALDATRSALAKVDADIVTAEEMLADAKARRAQLAEECRKAESELAYAEKMVGGALR